MSNDKKRTDLGFLGEDFQYKLVHEFLNNKEFFEELSVIIDQNVFTEPSLKTIVGVMKDRLSKDGCVPNYEMVGIELRQLSHSERECDTYMAVLEKIRNIDTSGVNRIKELAIKFFRQQNIVRAANEILRIAGEGDITKYDACVSLLNDAMNKGVHNDMGESPFEHLEQTLSDDYREPIPTGIEAVDQVLEGGLAKGELGVIIGPSGFGKTSLTSAMASYASTYKCPQNLYQGYKVLQIVFEDRIKQIQRKHIGRISGVEAKDLSKKEYIDQVKAAIDNFEDKEMMDRNLRIVKFASGEKTAKSIGRFINNLKNSGFSPDLVIVDYFECLAHEADKSTTNEYEKEGKTMRVFEAMVGELNIAMWIPSQGTKDSINLDIVTMDKIGGSVKKAQIAHIIMSIARTTDDLEHNNATIAILKNRAGQSGKIFQNVYFNNGTCVIDTSQSDTVDTMFEARKKQNEEQLALQKDIMKKLSEQKKEAQN